MTRSLKRAREALLENPRSVSDVELLGLYIEPIGQGTSPAERLLARTGGLVRLLNRVRSPVLPMASIGRRRRVLLRAAGEMATRLHWTPHSLALRPLAGSKLPHESVLKDLREKLLTGSGAATNLELLIVMTAHPAWPRVVTDILHQTRDLQELFELLSKGYRASPFNWRTTLASTLVAGVEVVRRYYKRTIGAPDVDLRLFTPAVLDLVETLLFGRLQTNSDAETLADTLRRFSQLDDYCLWLEAENLTESSRDP